MISIGEALGILQKNLPVGRFETVSLKEACGRYLAEPVSAPEPSPRYTNSAMDGYALRWSDVQSAGPGNPIVLSIIGESRAGLPFDEQVSSSEAVKISTGAMMPPGADSVVRIEDTRKLDDLTVEILTVHCQGQDVRNEGEEFGSGDKLLSTGTKLSARQLALLAAVGMHQVAVFIKPRVAVLVTGSELASFKDNEIKPYQIRDSNSVMLQSALQEAGARVHSCLHLEDDLLATGKAIETSFAQGVDFILCSGGISVGDHDHVREAAALVGFHELFWRIRQKPGKPLFAALKEKTFLFGLPGNPVSAYMCFIHYIKPLLYAMRGRGMTWNMITAEAGGDIVNRGSRTNFIRVQLARNPGRLPEIVDIRKQGSHMLSSIVNADGYIILEPGAEVKTGQTTTVYLF